MDALRLFIALPVRPDPPLRALLGAWAAHRAWLKPVAPEQLHVTLRFLGLCPAERVPALGQAIDRAVRAAGVPAVVLPFAGLAGLPPGGGRPLRVLYADLADAAPIAAL
ncbi:MAG: 2'-5' RNA ligase family protein, partial [Phycisphaeraceae bacterium]